LFRQICLLALLAPAAATAQAHGQKLDDETFFELKVRPLLAGKCFKCHAGGKSNGGLRLDSRAAVLKGGEHGPAVVPGDVKQSLLIRVIQHASDSDLKMPPGNKLASEAIADLTKWVQRGVFWPDRLETSISASSAPTNDHWAFRPVVRPSIPVDPSGWSANPIDRFIAARQRDAGLAPVAHASRPALIRRLTFDLLGLPPTPADIDQFLHDQSPAAYDRLVNRLLASSAYGERWGRHWMDVIRYADTAGDNADYPVPEASLYRDYIIKAFNDDKPYDQFVGEQIAGDLLASQGPTSAYAERVIATTYLGLARRYLTAPYESWELTLEDAIDTTGRAFLGLTLRCARCHDHKFDPVTREDYYALFGIFASTQFPYAGSEEFASMKKPREHFVPLVPPNEAAPKLEKRRRQLAQLSGVVSQLEKESPPARRVAALDAIIKVESELVESLRKQKASADDVAAELERHRSERAQWNKKLQDSLRGPRADLAAVERTNLPPDLPGAYGVWEAKPVDVPVQIGGDPAKPGPIVHRSAPNFLTAALPCSVPSGASGRLELARWMTQVTNPLTARVMVNRIWQYHFGRGLVGTPSNFGMRGEPPTHPELLDWLTRQFIDSGWSIKAVHRLIVTSNTYQLASSQNARNAVIDPANARYWRFDRRRLDAESIRDAMLAVGGNLDIRKPGQQPFPPITAWGWTQHHPFKDQYATNERSVYLMTQRLQRHPYLALFDGPDTNVTTDLRGSSTVPLQALYLMNNGFVREQALGLGRRLNAERSDDTARILLAYELAFGRTPAPEEIAQARHYLVLYKQAALGGDSLKQGKPLDPWASLAHVLLCANEFVFVD
jgi:hypothetical protein